MAVECNTGRARLLDERTVMVIDLPCASSLDPATPAEQAGDGKSDRGPPRGRAGTEPDRRRRRRTKLLMNLRLVLELRRLGRPTLVALNMADATRARGLAIDTDAMARELRCAVVQAVAVCRNGHAAAPRLRLRPDWPGRRPRQRRSAL